MLFRSECKPEEVANLKGDIARGEFIQRFKEVQRYKTQLEQYTELKEEDAARVEELLPKDTLRAFRGVYIDTAQRLKEQQGKSKERKPEIDDIDFEFVLFSSAIIDYDYIMSLISKYTQNTSKKEFLSKRELVDLLCSSSNLMDERTDIIEYIETLEPDKAKIGRAHV